MDARQRRDSLQSGLQRHHLAIGDDVHHRTRPRADPAVGGDQIVDRRVPFRPADGPQPFGRGAEEDVASQAVARHQPRPRLAHGIEPFEPELEAKRELLRIGVHLRLAGQEQGGFEKGEPGGHHEVIRREFEPQRLRLLDESEILPGEREHRDRAQVHLLLARERKQQVERPLPGTEIEGERVVHAAQRSGVRGG